MTIESSSKKRISCVCVDLASSCFVLFFIIIIICELLFNEFTYMEEWKKKSTKNEKKTDLLNFCTASSASTTLTFKKAAPVRKETRVK